VIDSWSHATGQFVGLKPQFAWDTLLLWLPRVVLLVTARSASWGRARQLAPAADKLEAATKRRASPHLSDL